MSFKTTNHLLFEKKKGELDVELLESFNPYIVTKSLSFLGMEVVEFTNDTLNVYGNIFETKEDKFKFFENMIPKTKKRKIDYIKRPKPEIKEDVMIPEFYSKRELDILDTYFK